MAGDHITLWRMQSEKCKVSTSVHSLLCLESKAPKGGSQFHRDFWTPALAITGVLVAEIGIYSGTSAKSLFFWYVLYIQLNKNQSEYTWILWFKMRNEKMYHRFRHYWKSIWAKEFDLFLTIFWIRALAERPISCRSWICEAFSGLWHWSCSM